MNPNLNLKGNQGHNMELGKPLNQSLQSVSENISSMSSNGSSKRHCGALKTNLKTCAKWTKWRVYNHSTTFHHISLVVFFISSFLFYPLLVFLHILSTLSGNPLQFITWEIVTSFPLFIPQTLIQRSLVWEGHLIKEFLLP